MQTIYTFSYTPAIATGTNTIGVNWRMAYQQPIMLYKGTANTIKIVVFATNQRVVNLTGYEIQVQIVDKETEEHYVTRTAIVNNPTSGVGTITFTEAELRNLENRFYHIIARLVLPGDGSSVTTSEILYLDDNYGAFLPIQIENAWNYQPTIISTENGAQVINFRSIGETPDSYTGHAGKLLQVNSLENAIEFTNNISTINIGDLSFSNSTIDTNLLDINFSFGTQKISFVDNSVDPNHNFGDGGFITFNDTTHPADGPRFEIWYGNVSEPADPPGQHSLDIRAAANSYVELASYDLNSFVGVDDIGPFIQTQWQDNPSKAWRFLGDGELRLPTVGSRITSEDSQLQIVMTFDDIRYVTTDPNGETTYQTIFDSSGKTFFPGDLLPGTENFPNPDLTTQFSLGSIDRSWKDLYLDNLTISNTTITPASTTLSLTGNFLPSTDNTYDLGSPTNQWKHLYVANGSIYIGNIKLTNENGKLGITTVINPGEENEAPDPSDSNAASTITSSLVNGEHEFKLENDGTLTLDGTPFTGSGGGAGPVQPYLELTNTPFIVQNVILGPSVTITAAPAGTSAVFEMLVEEGPVLTPSILQPGINYVVGQKYIIYHYQIGAPDSAGDYSFEVTGVNETGGITAIDNIVWGGSGNLPGTYSQLSIDYLPSVIDQIDTGLSLTRDNIRGLFNIVSEQQYDNNTHTSPAGTEWNADGWGDLTSLPFRSYTTLRSALNNAIGNNIIGKQLVMHDIANDKYYKFNFTAWGENSAGGFAYTRNLITDPNYFEKKDNGNEVDVFIEDVEGTPGIGITRAGNNSIYNPYREEGYAQNLSPLGTIWNADGWDDLSNITTRTYSTFYGAFNGGLGNKVPGSKTIMHIPENGKYYAIQWFNWTQGGNGGGFSYLRYEIDLTQLNQGIKFADGSVLKSASDFNRIKSTASGERRIEEVSGSKTVSVTSRTTNDYTGASNRTTNTNYEIFVTRTPELDAILQPIYNNGGAEILISFDNMTFLPVWLSSIQATEYWFYYENYNSYVPQTQGNPVYIRITSGADPVVWWNKNELPGGGANFRGAVIDYHAYSGEATWIGTIHIVDDSGENHISHTEVASGSTDSENDDLWLVQNEGTISYRRIDGESKTLKVHWTAKVFYGSEFWD